MCALAALWCAATGSRVAARTESGNHLRYSGKRRAFGGNVQVLTDHAGFPVRTAPVEPGSTHD